ncbi:MAG TPA: alpha/beta hydrolase [Actinomycetota bacterium]|nr:alpha/beta hydrolase [Actinomycetota bacterium]
MPFLERDRARIFFDDTGTDAVPILFSHGILMDHEMFEPQVHSLRGEFRCITWDARGHGQTDHNGPFTYWDSAQDALALLDLLDIERAFFVGMSQGGFASLRAALLAPERVQGLCLIDTQAGPEDPDAAPTYEAMVAAWEEQPTVELAEAAARIILGPADHAPWIAKWMARPKDALRDPFGALMGREDIHDRLDEIDCPALVIHGTEDPAVSMAKAETLCAGLPRCDGLLKIEGAGHAANLTHPGVVTEALRDFVQRHSA